MNYFIVELFFGVVIAMVLYLIVISVKINSLEFRIQQMFFELERQEKELDAYRCMYASAYDGFEDTK